MAEFALVFPVLVMVILACMEFGWYFLNYYAVSQYNKAALKCIPWPRGDKQTEIDLWGDTSVSKPSWMTAEDVASGYSKAYDGWVAFDDEPEYFYPTFEENMRGVPTLLDRERIQTTVEGGWLANAMGLYRPKQQGVVPSEDDIYANESVYMYADVKIEVSYTFRPLTPLGIMFFCADGADSCQMVVEERAERTFEQSLNIWGMG